MSKAAVLLITMSAVSGALTASVSAQYTFEMRLIPDGVAGAPTGPGSTYNIGNPNAVTATRIGFWLQARVAQTLNQNWGINRFSRPAASQGGGEAFIQVTDPANGITISRGTVDAAGTLFGRGDGYRNGPGGNTNNTNTGTTGTNLENGALDGSGPGGGPTRIYAIDAYMGASRNGTANPWGVNGGPAGPVWPSNGTFAPWANLYRFWIDISDFSPRTVTIDARGLLNGTVQTQNIGGGFWLMQTNVPAGQVASSIYELTTSSFNFHFVPTPAAAAALGLGGLAALRRRR
ncbi:MAG: hypothetical protein Q8L55_07355 [Phycisphaerales bacterium]|nr:hypothetical protein [Phycisphaerales bacterium]